MTGISVAKETICCGLDMYMNVGYYTSKGIGCITWFNMAFSYSLVHDTHIGIRSKVEVRLG